MIDWPTFLAQVKLAVWFGSTEVKPCIWLANQLCKALIVCYKKEITWNPWPLVYLVKHEMWLPSSDQVGHWGSSVALLVHQAAHETPKRSVTPIRPPVYDASRAGDKESSWATLDVAMSYIRRVGGASHSVLEGLNLFPSLQEIPIANIC